MLYVPRLTVIVTTLLCMWGTFGFTQQVNQFNANKKRTGVWKKYYPNKALRYTGQFVNGKEVGLFQFYHEKHPSVLNFSKNFSKTSDSAFVKYYTLKGKVNCEGFMLGRNRVGTWTYFFPNGKILSTETHTDGKLNGVVYNYYPNGKTLEETNYVHGTLSGSSKKFSEDGVLLEEVTYENGVLNGPAKYYELNGKLKEKGIYKNGKRFGDWDFYIDGEIADDKAKKADRKITPLKTKKQKE